MSTVSSLPELQVSPRFRSIVASKNFVAVIRYEPFSDFFIVVKTLNPIEENNVPIIVLNL